MDNLHINMLTERKRKFDQLDDKQNKITSYTIINPKKKYKCDQNYSYNIQNNQHNNHNINHNINHNHNNNHNHTYNNDSGPEDDDMKLANNNDELKSN